MRAQGDAPRRDRRPLADALRGMGEEALEYRGAQARPDQAFGNVRVRGVEVMQVRLRLPLLEAEFDLPAEPIESGDQVQRERCARRIGAQPRHRRLASRQDHDAEADDAGPWARTWPREGVGRGRKDPLRQSTAVLSRSLMYVR